MRSLSSPRAPSEARSNLRNRPSPIVGDSPQRAQLACVHPRGVHRSRRRRRPPVGADASDLSRAHPGPSSRIRIVQYDSSTFSIEERFADAISTPPTPHRVTWFDVALPSASDLESLRQRLHLAPLAVSDAAHPPQRPHYATWSDFELLVLVGPGAGDQLQQVCLFLGSGWVLSIRENEEDLFAPVRERIRERIGPLREGSAALLTSALVSTLLDALFEQVEDTDERIADWEERLIEGVRLPLGTLHRFGRRWVRARLSVEPMRAAIKSVATRQTQRWDDEARVHLREAGEDAQHLLDIIEEGQSHVASLENLDMSLVRGRTNAVLTMLTVVSTLFLPMTFLTGLWGMNFTYMPELTWRWGYVFALTMIAVSALVPLIIIMRKQNWFRSLEREPP